MHQSIPLPSMPPPPLPHLPTFCPFQDFTFIPNNGTFLMAGTKMERAGKKGLVAYCPVTSGLHLLTSSRNLHCSVHNHLIISVSHHYFVYMCCYLPLVETLHDEVPTTNFSSIPLSHHPVARGFLEILPEKSGGGVWPALQNS